MYFYLKEPNGDKDTLIILKYFISKQERFFTFSTKLFVNPSDWDKKSKMAIAKRGRSDLNAINRKLQGYANFLDKTLSHYELNDVDINKEKLRTEFSKEYNPEAVKTSKFTYFTDFVDDFINKAPELTNRSTKRKYSLKKIKHYKKTNNRLKEYEAYCKSKLRIDDITMSHYDKLVDYLKINRGYAVNTVGDLIKNIKVFLNKAEEFGYVVHKDYKDSNFTVLKEDSVSIALSEDEIEQIFIHDFSNKKKLENCRDLAIIGMWTGLRVQDFLSLPKIKQDDNFITVQPKKTKLSSGVKVVIPLHHHIKEIIEKRGMPRAISDVKFNLYIKEVCKEVGLTDIVKGGKMIRENKNSPLRKKIGLYPKHELVSSHTCRRSFATNLYKMNFPTLSIMKITGHTTEKSFLTYIKVTPNEHAEKLLEHWKEYYKNKG